MKKLANWNPSRGLWEDLHGAIDLFSEHSEPYSATWPSSGTTRNGVAYELPTPALPMPDSAFSFLPTPEAKLAVSGPDYARASRPKSGTDDLTTTVFKNLLPTPVVTDAAGTRNATANRSNPDSKHHTGYTLTHVLLPTPSAINPNDGENVESWLARRERVKAKGINGNGFGTPLAIAVQLLPTPTVQDGSNLGGPLPILETQTAAEHGGATDWGVYAPAVEHWEELIDRPAPDPTKPDGKGGKRRLSAEFVEWMMGLPAGHVTDPAMWGGMTSSWARNAQLKALGNGVVPQQAALAVSILLERVHA